jgi:hypothetical protein
VTAAAEQYGRIPAAIIAAVAETESSGNPNIGPTRVRNSRGLPSTSAYGLGQITIGTAQAAVRGGYLPPGFDRTDPEQGAAGIGGVLSMKLDQAGGDLAKALQSYYGSRAPGANQAYAADVLRRAGQMGDASTLGQVREADANARALQTANDNLRLNTELYGRNGLALEAQTTANRMLSDQLARGVPLTDALRASIDSFATSSATAAQKLKLVQFASDTGFEREQLGRDRYDQAAYSRARSTVGDTTSPGAQAVIDQSRSNQYLSDARSTLTDAASGFATALSHGENAAKAFGNALSRISDKLLSGLVDSLVGSLFKSGGGGLGSLFGFADGGYTGDGGKYQPAGIVHAVSTSCRPTWSASTGGASSTGSAGCGATRTMPSWPCHRSRRLCLQCPPRRHRHRPRPGRSPSRSTREARRECRGAGCDPAWRRRRHVSGP